jgi:hypothetical protein
MYENEMLNSFVRPATPPARTSLQQQQQQQQSRTTIPQQTSTPSHGNSLPPSMSVSSSTICDDSSTGSANGQTTSQVMTASQLAKLIEKEREIKETELTLKAKYLEELRSIDMSKYSFPNE